MLNKKDFVDVLYIVY